MSNYVCTTFRSRALFHSETKNAFYEIYKRITKNPYPRYRRILGSWSYRQSPCQAEQHYEFTVTLMLIIIQKLSSMSHTRHSHFDFVSNITKGNKVTVSLIIKKTTNSLRSVAQLINWSHQKYDHWWTEVFTDECLHWSMTTKHWVLCTWRMVLSTICWSWSSFRFDPTIIFKTYNTKRLINKMRWWSHHPI